MPGNKDSDDEQTRKHKKSKKRHHHSRDDEDRKSSKKSKKSRKRSPSGSIEGSPHHTPPAPIESEEPNFDDTSGGNKHVESLSIDETNKLRAKLGLAPLDVGRKDTDTGTTEDGAKTFKDENDGKEYVHVPADNIADKKATEALKERLAVQKEKRQVSQQLSKVKGLGEAAKHDRESAADWVAKLRNIEEEKKQAEERQRMLDEMDNEFGVGTLVDEEFAPKKVALRQKANRRRPRDRGPDGPSITAAGLKVEHSKDAFLEGKETILVLKDKDILNEDDGEILVNPTLQEHEQWSKNAEFRKKKPGYNPFEEELDPLAPPKQLLSKYDEEIEGKQLSSFVLDSRGQTDLTTEQFQADIRAKLKESEQDLELKPLELAKEYYTKEEMAQFKKPKKKVRKVRKRGKVTADELLKTGLTETPTTSQSDLGSRQSRRQKTDEANASSGAATHVDANPDGEAMEIEHRLSSDEDDLIGPNEDVLEEAFNYSEEDEAETELASALERARRLKRVEVKSEPTVPVEAKVAETLKRIKPEPMDEDFIKGENGVPTEDDEGNTIVFDVVSEYCRGLGDIPTFGMAGNRKDTEISVSLYAEEREAPSTVEDLSDHEDRDVSRPPEKSSKSRGKEGAWVEMEFGDKNGEFPPLESDDESDEDTVLDKEPDVRKGVAGALQVAVQKGYVGKEKAKREANEELKHMYAQRYSIEDKQFTDIDDKYTRKLERMGMGGPISDFKEKNDYVPDFKLEYPDERGKLMTPKEAFQYQSWKFHGKRPGKNKLEKNLKKEREERLLNEMSSSDTPLATLRKQREKQKQVQQPYIVLSGRSKDLAN